MEQEVARSHSGPGTHTGGLFRQLLPERSVEDVLTGTLRVRFGGTEFQMPVLVIEKADAWRNRLQSEFVAVVAALDGKTDAAGVLAFMASHTPKMVELLRAYDGSAKLPDDEWLRKNATEPEVLRGFMLVLAASFPFIAAALDILAANPGALKMVLEEFRPAPSLNSGESTSTSPAPTAGPSNRSARRSRTSSSRAT